MHACVNIHAKLIVHFPFPWVLCGAKGASAGWNKSGPIDELDLDWRQNDRQSSEWRDHVSGTAAAGVIQRAHGEFVGGSVHHQYVRRVCLFCIHSFYAFCWLCWFSWGFHIACFKIMDSYAFFYVCLCPMQFWKSSMIPVSLQACSSSDLQKNHFQ